MAAWVQLIRVRSSIDADSRRASLDDAWTFLSGPRIQSEDIGICSFVRRSTVSTELTTLRIGACELDLGAGEVRVAGERQAVEPRVLALLRHLAERPDRVVTKHELREAVWRGRPASDAALTRAVLKARRVIGDSGTPRLIRNVPHVGYRLVVPLPDDRALASFQPAPSPPRRLAILPFDNATGDTAMDWVRLGLVSLVAHSIGHDPRLSVLAPPAAPEAPDGAQTPDIGPIDDLRPATGAQVVVRGSVSRSGDRHELAIECAGIGTSRVHADSAGELAPRAAQAIVAMLFPDAATVTAPPPASGDPLATTAFARALRASAQQKYLPAANLLRMTLALAPGSAPVELELLRALCALGDLDGSLPLARRLLADADRRPDRLLAARIHLALGRAWMCHSSFLRAASHVEQGLFLLAGQGPLDEQASGHLLQAQIAAFALDHDAVERALERMRAACELSGNRLLDIARLMMLASLAWSRSDCRTAAALSVRAAHAADEMRARRYAATAHVNAAAALVHFGQWNDAASHAEQGFAAAACLGDPSAICAAAALGTWVYMITGVPAAAQRMIEAMPAEDRLAPLDRPRALIARANHAASIGDHAAAARQLTQALARLHDGGDRLTEACLLPWLLCALVRCGQLDEAEATLGNASQSLGDRGPIHARLAWLHCRAQLAHARGRPARALQLLLQLVAADTVPLWHNWAVLDAAWLCAEQGRSAQALGLLQRVAPEFATQPLATAVAARVRFGAGDAAAAQRLHRRYRDATHAGIVHPFLADLGSGYAGTGGAVPPAPALPSRL